MANVRPKADRVRLEVGLLERRELLSAGLSGNTLFVEGGSADDVVRIRMAGDELVVWENHEIYRFDASSIKRIVILTKAGHDRVTIDPSITMPVVVRAGAGDDLIRGGSGDDRLYGGPGDDRLYGRRGDDDLFGQSGDDMLYGQAGDDDLYGHRGHDALYGGRGRDRLRGGRDWDDYYHYERHYDDLPRREWYEYERHRHEHDDDSDDSHEYGGSYEYETEYKAFMTGANGEWAKVEYEVENEHGYTEIEFEVKIRGAQPGDVYPVYVDGVYIGDVVIGPGGMGKVEWTNRPYKPYHRPLPDNFPAITDGTVVQVGDMTGTLRFWVS